MAKKRTIRVGIFTDPQPDDEKFSNVVSARLHAQQLNQGSRYTAVAVWIDDQLDRVFYAGYELKPVP